MSNKSSEEILNRKLDFLCSGNEATTHNNIIALINPFMHFVEKWPKVLQKSCNVHIARF